MVSNEDTRAYKPLLPKEQLAQHIYRAQQECGLFVEGDDGMMHALEELVLQCRSSAIITITGEPGVGKELFARFTHVVRHPDKSFVAVNMAGVSEHLFESEMFGHVKGAFTGANGSREGRFDEAGKGTLFLDEIGDMPPGKQALLLRALGFDRDYSPVGSNDVKRVAASIVCATNVDIHRAMHGGQMRPDLYGRLCGCVVQIPPLRDRKTEHRYTLQHFLLRRIADTEFGARRFHLTSAAQEMLVTAPMPRNVRGLEDVIRRICSYAAAVEVEEIGTAFVERALAQEAPFSPRNNTEGDGYAHAVRHLVAPAQGGGLLPLLDRIKHDIIHAVHGEKDGCVTEAARALGIDPQTVRRYLRE